MEYANAVKIGLKEYPLLTDAHIDESIQSQPQTQARQDHNCGSNNCNHTDDGYYNFNIPDPSTTTTNDKKSLLSNSNSRQAQQQTQSQSQSQQADNYSYLSDNEINLISSFDNDNNDLLDFSNAEEMELLESILHTKFSNADNIIINENSINAIDNLDNNNNNNENIPVCRDCTVIPLNKQIIIENNKNKDDYENSSVTSSHVSLNSYDLSNKSHNNNSIMNQKNVNHKKLSQVDPMLIPLVEANNEIVNGWMQHLIFNETLDLNDSKKRRANQIN